MIACEPKRDASAFDPDERESLSAIARAIAPALEFEHAADERELLLKAIEKLGANKLAGKSGRSYKLFQTGENGFEPKKARILVAQLSRLAICGVRRLPYFFPKPTVCSRAVPATSNPRDAHHVQMFSRWSPCNGRATQGPKRAERPRTGQDRKYRKTL